MTAEDSSRPLWCLLWEDTLPASLELGWEIFTPHSQELSPRAHLTTDRAAWWGLTTHCSCLIWAATHPTLEGLLDGLQARPVQGLTASCPSPAPMALTLDSRMHPALVLMVKHGACGGGCQESQTLTISVHPVTTTTSKPHVLSVVIMNFTSFGNQTILSIGSHTTSKLCILSERGFLLSILSLR